MTYEENKDFGTGVIIIYRTNWIRKNNTFMQKSFKNRESDNIAFTNKALENIKNALKVKYRLETEKVCHTFDSYFCEWNGKDIEDLKNKTIFIEEFSMVPNKWMTLIYKHFCNTKTKYIYSEI